MTVIRRNQSAIEAALKSQAEAAARESRAQAFRHRSDPLLGKLLRGEITQAAFDAVAAQIRAEFPYPDEDAT